MKKIIAIVMALAMIVAMATVVSAESGKFDTHKGSITINKYNPNNKYSIYLMLKLESFDTAGDGKYSYVVAEGWEDFFAVGGDGYEYITIVDGKYITWNSAKAESEAVLFAQKALAYANAHPATVKVMQTDKKDVVNEVSVTIDNINKTCKFENLPLGYYLVDSTMGALCGLTTTNPNASVNAKNGEPTIKKHALEDSNNQWVLENTASIGDIVQYRITVTTQPGAENYVIHDQMADALEFVAGSVKIEYEGATVAGANYHVSTPGAVDATCDLEISFEESFLKTLAANKSLVVYYEAKLNANAVIAGDGNKNTCWLTFGDDHESHKDEITTKSYAFDLVKTDGQNFLLDGAWFKMFYKDEHDNKVYVSLIWDESDPSNPHYRPALTGETGTITEFEVDGGKIRFEGFDSGDYYFEETKAPEGYNKLSAPVMFTLGNANKDAIFNTGVYSSGSGFHITNLSGTMLPETGGLGTLLFTLVGGTTALGTGVVLVTKKRMSMIEDEE